MLPHYFFSVVYYLLHQHFLYLGKASHELAKAGQRLVDEGGELVEGGGVAELMTFPAT